MEKQEAKATQQAQETGVMVSNSNITTVDMFDQNRAKGALMVASQLSTSSLIPEHYQRRPDNVMVAMYRAARLGMDVFAYMESTYPIKGKLGHESKFVISLLNTSGIFKGPVRYELSGEIIRDAKDKVLPTSTRKCKAWAILKDDGTRVEQESDIGMAFREGWVQRGEEKGHLSKWHTMPDIMLQYRAAKFLGNMYAPEVVMGLNTKDELEDIQEAEVINEQAGKDIFEKDAEINTAAEPVLDPAKEIKQASQATVVGIPEPEQKTQTVLAVQEATPAEQKNNPAPAVANSVQESIPDSATPPDDVASFRVWILKRFGKESTDIDCFLLGKKWLTMGETLADLTDSKLKSLRSQWEKFLPAYETFKKSRKS